MKKIKIILIVFLSLFFLSSCSSVKKGLAGSKAKGSDEFLVKKKICASFATKFYDFTKTKQR